MLKDVLKTVNEYLETITDLVKTLVIIGIIVEIIFPNRFGVIENLERDNGTIRRCRVCRSFSNYDACYVV